VESPIAIQRRPLDLLQVAAAVCIAALIAGEIAIFVFVFKQHRSRRMRVEASDVVQSAATNGAAASLKPGSGIVPATTNASTAAMATTPSSSGNVPAAPVLNPALKIQSVQRTGVKLQLKLRAQTGEREFDPRAARVGVEWQLADGTKRTEWLALPAVWDNFTARTVQARFDGTATQLRGATVRTFYRDQLQEQTQLP